MSAEKILRSKILFNGFNCFFEIFSDLDMLGTCFFAFSAFDAVGSGSFAEGGDPGMFFVVDGDLVENIEDSRNSNIFGADFQAVFAGSAGDGFDRADDFNNFV